MTYKTYKDKLMTGVHLDESNKLVMSFSDNSKIEIDYDDLNNKLSKLKSNYKVKELWIDVPGHGIEDLNPNDLVKFHVASEYSDNKIQLIDEYVKVDDLIKFLNNYGKK